MLKNPQNTSSAEKLPPARIAERPATENQARNVTVGPCNQDAFLSEAYLDAALESSFPASDPLPSGRV